MKLTKLLLSTRGRKIALIRRKMNTEMKMRKSKKAVTMMMMNNNKR